MYSFLFAAALRVLDKSLSFHDAEQALYGFVFWRTARGEPSDDVLDRAFPIFPQRPNIRSSGSVGTPVFDAERDRRLIIVLGV